jgi:uridine phosphorylase
MSTDPAPARKAPGARASVLAAPPPAPEAIINPVREAWEEPVTARVILTFTRPDYERLCRLAQAAAAPRYLWDCALRAGSWQGQPVTIAAPTLGAPYAAMVLEKLIALGARLALALGWCGSLQPHVGLGDLLLPTAAVSGDGTSRYYCSGEQDPGPDAACCARLRQALAKAQLPWHAGPVWSTDALYRETVDLVWHYQARGILGVDMEMAALFAVGRFRGVAVAGLLVVAEELADLKWRPGYRSAAFRQARRQAAELALTAAAQWSADYV